MQAGVPTEFPRAMPVKNIEFIIIRALGLGLLAALAGCSPMGVRRTIDARATGVQTEISPTVYSRMDGGGMVH